ncbi:MAG: type II secretion system protein [Myxococcales bacterium]
MHLAANGPNGMGVARYRGGSMRHRSRPTRARAAFTIVELMIALVIIGIMAASVAPAIGEVIADQRQSGAAAGVIRTSITAQSRATATGVAHLLRFLQGNNADSLGVLELHMGMKRRCLQTDWETSVAGGGLPAYERFEMAEFNPTQPGQVPSASDGGRQVITLRPSTDASDPAKDSTDFWICYQPNGVTYIQNESAGKSMIEQNEPVTFVVARSVDSVKRGVDREVIFPLGGTARIR